MYKSLDYQIYYMEKEVELYKEKANQDDWYIDTLAMYAAILKTLKSIPPRAIRKCKNCTNVFEIGQSVGRKSKKYCSTACKVNYHRYRQQLARTQYLTKKPINEIAKELGTTENIIIGWIK